MAIVLPSCAFGDVIFTRPTASSSTVIPSAWVWEDGSDSDLYAYDDFILPADANLTEVRWRGGYTHAAMWGEVINFSIAVFEGYPGGNWPICGNPGENDAPYIYKIVTGSLCNPVAAPNGMKDHSFTLPSPLHLQGNKAYWLRVEGYQPLIPDWGIATSSQGNGSYFRFSTGSAMFNFMTGNIAFTLVGDFDATTISGAVSLTDWAAPLTGLPITVEILDSQLNVVDTKAAVLNENGHYAISTSQSGSRSVRISSLHFLKKRVGTINLAGTPVAGVNAVLTNGDPDGSGEVDAVDIDLVILGFGSADPTADMDGSGEVDATDIDITIANFGAVGD
ncbi:MAG: hypothetical protein JNK63_09595 [Chthonomonas sp.]|nr:hypothetical protein [Chthonomonas sp.]